MNGDALPLPAEMAGETLPPPLAEMGGEAQQPAAEVESDTQQLPAETEGPTRLPACVSKVLDDDNLLPEIIVRVGFPTTLVRAAAVCRRWFALASDRAFLRRFRKLHPPSLLGFYLAQREHPDATARFFPMLPHPPPPELAAVVRRASFSLDLYDGERTDTARRWNGRVVEQADMAGCWNGRVFTRLLFRDQEHTNRWGMTFVVHSPLCSDRGTTQLPTLQVQFPEDSLCTSTQLFSKEEGDAVSYLYVMILEPTLPTAQVYILRNGDDSWRTHLILPLNKLTCTRSEPGAVLVGNKIYMASSRPQLVVLDLTASSFSTIKLPLGVDFHTIGTTMLSRGVDDDSAVYLIQAKRQQLHIWLHKGDNWLLVDKICLREMCAPLREDEPTASLRIKHAGDYTADFLFLEMGRFVLYLDVKCKTLRKVYEKESENQNHTRIYPFRMIWPPIFPALKDGPPSNAT